MDNGRPVSVEGLVVEHLDVWASAVRRRSAAGRGASKKVELYGVKKLRELILELAVRGLLVAQDASDEPASVLLKRIAAEKVRLVKEGKIKKSDLLPLVADDEKPFEIPEGWEWVRLDSLSLHSEAGWSPKCEEFPRTGNNWGVLKVSAVTWGTFDPVENKALPANLEPRPEFEVRSGDFLISRANTAELVARSVVVQNDAPLHLMMSDKIIRFVFNSEVFSEYLNLFNNSSFARKYYLQVAGGTSSSMKNVSRLQIQMLTVPLPSLAEQHRIVAKVDELMALCDQLEQHTESSLTAHQTLVETLLGALTGAADHAQFALAWQRLADHFDSLFTTEDSIDQLKQAILQLAVMGKLVPQDPSDEPAAVLLKKIAAEKARLVKEGKIKKEKALPPVAEEEKPFAVPEGWAYSYISEVSLCLDYLRVPVNKEERLRRIGDVPYYGANGQVGYIDEFIFDEDLVLVVEDETFIGRTKPFSYIVRGKSWVNNHAHVLRPLGCISVDYLNLCLQYYDFIPLTSGTTGRKKLTQAGLMGARLLIAPLAEQHRIVTKVDELMALCDQLKARLTAAQTTRVKLADAVAAGVLV